MDKHKKELLRRAEPYGLEPEVLESYEKFRKEGFTPEMAAFHAAYEWDLVIEQDEDQLHIDLPATKPPEETVNAEIQEALHGIDKEYEMENSGKNPEAFNRLKTNLSSIWKTYVKEIYRDDN
jgi:hypothetical protein